jgi:hypothetical protein
VTTFVRSRRNDLVLVGLFVVMAGAAAVRAALAGSTVAAIVAGAIALGLVGFGVWLNARRGLELQVSADEIVLVGGGRVVGRIGCSEAGGRVAVEKQIIRGHAWFSVAAATGDRLPLEGFRMSFDELAAACEAHGWQLAR